MTTQLADYAEKLYGCRFCPMCKPKGEVSRVTQKESHTTRGRALVLWRILSGYAQWDARAVELIYEAGLDSASGAWCVSDYPVAQYILAARREIVASGLAPSAVTTLNEQLLQTDVTADAPQASTLVYSDDASAAGDWLPLLGNDAAALVSGKIGLAYSLGLVESAQVLGQRLVQALRQSGARQILADGPMAYWALTNVLPELGLALPDGVRVTFGTAWLAEHNVAGSGQSVIYHDSAFYRLAALDYELPRRVLAAGGAQVVEYFGTNSRALADDAGVEGGLHHLYPDLAAAVARMRLAGKPAGDLIVTDCPDSAGWLARSAGDGVRVMTLAAWARQRVASPA
ncbi:MAG: (Fe-S)-binding protein [Anaerolineae bacterium]|nr:(Fe-S)-binding protein [Anaerolineae bacterium]